MKYSLFSAIFLSVVLLPVAANAEEMVEMTAVPTLISVEEDVEMVEAVETEENAEEAAKEETVMEEPVVSLTEKLNIVLAERMFNSIEEAVEAGEWSEAGNLAIELTLNEDVFAHVASSQRVSVADVLINTGFGYKAAEVLSETVITDFSEEEMLSFYTNRAKAYLETGLKYAALADARMVLETVSDEDVATRADANMVIMRVGGEIENENIEREGSLGFFGLEGVVLDPFLTRNLMSTLIWRSDMTIDEIGVFVFETYEYGPFEGSIMIGQMLSYYEVVGLEETLAEEIANLSELLEVEAEEFEMPGLVEYITGDISISCEEAKKSLLPGGASEKAYCHSVELYESEETEASEELTEALELSERVNPGSPDNAVTRAYILQNASDSEGALKELSVIEVDALSIRDTRLLADVHESLGNEAKATDLRAKADLEKENYETMREDNRINEKIWNGEEV